MYYFDDNFEKFKRECPWFNDRIMNKIVTTDQKVIFSIWFIGNYDYHTRTELKIECCDNTYYGLPLVKADGSYGSYDIKLRITDYDVYELWIENGNAYNGTSRSFLKIMPGPDAYSLKEYTKLFKMIKWVCW